MSENGIVQTLYRNFVKNVEMDSTVDDETKEFVSKRWLSLQKQLQTWGFVHGGIIPLLSRKLDYYWSKNGDGRAIISFQERLNANAKLMGFNNGVWDFTTFEFRDGKPKDYISLSTNINFTLWDKIFQRDKDELLDFLKKIFPIPNHLKYFLQEVSSCLDGTQIDQRIFLMTGDGANGKSTLVRLLNITLGDYAGEANITLFTKPRPPANAPTPELIALIGKRFVVCSEPNAKDPLQLGTIKWLSGGDRITAAQKFQANQSFYLQSTFFVLTNTIPPIKAETNDHGTWRRMRPVTFVNRFVDKPVEELKEHEIQTDNAINEKMQKWTMAFASLLIHCLLKKTKYTMPKEFHKKWQEMQNNNDTYGRFVREHVNLSPDNFTEKMKFFQEFENWHKSLSKGNTFTHYDHFESNMLRILGPLVENKTALNDVVEQGWKAEVKKTIPL